MAAPVNKEAHRTERQKNPTGKDDVRQELLEGATRGQDDGTRRAPDDGQSRRAEAWMNLSEAAEKDTITSHGEVDARSGQRYPIGGAEHGYQNCGRDQF